MARRPPLAKVDAGKVIVHLLVGDKKAACGRPAGNPASWPQGHLWVRVERGHLLSCPKCQQLLPEVRGDKNSQKQG
jgi:hypothetical protein